MSSNKRWRPLVSLLNSGTHSLTEPHKNHFLDKEALVILISPNSNHAKDLIDSAIACFLTSVKTLKTIFIHKGISSFTEESSAELINK